MTENDLIKKVQAALNAAGAKLSEDGAAGPQTLASAELYDFTAKIKSPIAAGAPIVKPSLEWFGAPWIGANIDLLGRSEHDPELNARYVPEWAFEGLPGYKTLAGNAYAWCSVRENADKRKVRVKGTNSAGAASWSSYGVKSPFWFGCTLPILHSGGGRHVCDFLYWIDEANMLCATLDGNRSDKFDVNLTNLSGNAKGHDELFGGPRWPKDYPAGREVSMHEVLAAYPMLKVGSTGVSTR